MNRPISALSAIALATLNAAAQSAPLSGLDADEPAARVRLVSESSPVATGSKAWIGVEFDIADDWHIYWPGQNDSGYAPEVEWTLPAGVEVGPIHWPAPHRYTLPGDILDHVYEGHVLLLAELTIPTSLASGSTLELAAHVSWLECADGCVPREADVSLTLPVAAQAAPSADAPLFKRTLARIPAPAPSSLAVSWHGASRVTIRAANPGIARLAFYPADSGLAVESLLAQGEVERDALTLTVKPKPGVPFRGVVEAWNAKGDSLGVYAIESEPPRN